MLQKNSFFSTPLIFFGSHQDSEEDDEMDEDEWNYSESWILTMNANAQNNQQNKIGLFILWADLEQE